MTGVASEGEGRAMLPPRALACDGSAIQENKFWRDSSSGGRMVSWVLDGLYLMCLWVLQSGQLQHGVSRKKEVEMKLWD